MTATTIAAPGVEVNEEGFLVHPEQWTEDMAPELARKEGIDHLTVAHWKVIRFMRAGVPRKGNGANRVVRGPSWPVGEGSSSPSASWSRWKTMSL